MENNVEHECPESTHLFNNILLIIISKCPAQLIVIHPRALFELSPALRHLLLIA